MKVIWSIKQNQQRYFDARGLSQVITVLKVLPARVLGFRRQDKDGYDALILGLGRKDLKEMKKPQREWLKKVGLDQGFDLIKEVKINSDELGNYKAGQALDLWSEIEEGSLAKVRGTMKGRGFAGGVKRWGFHGGPRTHGQSDRERAPGSIGSGTTPGRVVKGKKMAGHYGNVKRTVTNLTVLAFDKINSLLLLRGLVPGKKGGLIRLEVNGFRKVDKLNLNLAGGEAKKEEDKQEKQVEKGENNG